MQESRHRKHSHPKGGGKKRGGRKRSRRRGGAKGAYRQPDELTSHPITRNAYVGTREWLLETHGPVCAYCGTRHSASTMTLDHVAPRRGQTAYDRRDNLVLCCQSCNKKKRDLAPLAFLLGDKKRAINLVRYGWHLSDGLIDLAKSLLPPDWKEPDEDSPYRD
jgi:5-methylcytosine-specific restriction endonuclease McrA